MGAKEQAERENKSFLHRYRFLIAGILGAILLVATLSTENVILAYQLEDGTQYAVKLEYSSFGMCIRCYPGNQASNDITEKAIFFGTGKKKSIKNAAAALQELAENDQGSFRLQESGLTSRNEKGTQELVQYLSSLGYAATAVED